jgi:hypothetical protein
MRKIGKQQYEKIKSVLSAIEKGAKVSSYEFLKLYNRATGRQESSNCSSCNKRRVAQLKLIAEDYERANINPPEPEPKPEIINGAPVLVDEVAEEIVEPTKKKGRPKGSKNKAKKDTNEKGQ